MAPDPVLADQIRRYRAEFARNPESLAFARLADAYRKAGEAERALDLLERGLRRHPRYLSGHVVRARTLLELGRTEEALQAYRRVLEVDPRNLVALREIGRLAVELGRPDEAAAAYRRLWEIDPLDEEVHERLAEAERAAAPPSAGGAAAADRTEPGGEVEAGERETPEAEEPEAARAREEAEEVVVTVTMGELFLRQGLHGQAVRVFERLLARRPDDPLLAEKLDTARRLAGGDGPEPGPERPGPGVEGDGSERGGAGAGGARTIREYLKRLLEGRAEVRSEARVSAFERWVDEGRDREVDGGARSRRISTRAGEGEDGADRRAERPEP